MKRGGGLGRTLLTSLYLGFKKKERNDSDGSSLQKNLLKICFMAGIVLSEKTRKNRDGPYPQGAHSLLSYLSDPPTRL